MFTCNHVKQPRLLCETKIIYSTCSSQVAVTYASDIECINMPASSCHKQCTTDALSFTVCAHVCVVHLCCVCTGACMLVCVHAMCVCACVRARMLLSLWCFQFWRAPLTLYALCTDTPQFTFVYFSFMAYTKRLLCMDFDIGFHCCENSRFYTEDVALYELWHWVSLLWKQSFLHRGCHQGNLLQTNFIVILASLSSV